MPLWLTISCLCDSGPGRDTGRYLSLFLSIPRSLFLNLNLKLVSGDGGPEYGGAAGREKICVSVADVFVLCVGDVSVADVFVYQGMADPNLGAPLGVRSLRREIYQCLSQVHIQRESERERERERETERGIDRQKDREIDR